MSVFDFAFISIVYSSVNHTSLLPNRIIVRGRYGGFFFLACFSIE